MAGYFFSSPVDIDVKLEGEEVRKQVELKLEKERKESCPVYYDGDSIVGQVCVGCFGSGVGCLTCVCVCEGDNTCAGWEEVHA
jgi:hypothetical protein